MRIGIAAMIAMVTLTGCSAARSDGALTTGRPSGPATATSAAADPRADAERVSAQNQRNEQAAGREAALLLASMSRPAGSRAVSVSEVPPLAQTGASLSGSNLSETRTGFWLVPGEDPHALADWYTLHPPVGMSATPHAIGGSNSASRSYEEAFYDGNPTGNARDSEAMIELTQVGTQVGVRITVYSFWRPARALVSFTPSDVSALRIEVVRDSLTRTVVVSDSAAVERLRNAYDALQGTHGLSHSCPLLLHRTDYRLTFISPTRQIVATSSQGCVHAWMVTANGVPVGPALEESAQFESLIAKLAS